MLNGTLLAELLPTLPAGTRVEICGGATDVGLTGRVHRQVGPDVYVELDAQRWPIARGPHIYFRGNVEAVS